MWGHRESARDGRDGQLRRTKQIARLLPLAFLGLSLGVAGLGAWEAYRAQRSHLRTAAAVLSEYGGFAAWSYERKLEEVFGTALAGSVSFATTRQTARFLPPTEERLSRALAGGDTRCTCQASLVGGFAFYARVGTPTSDAVWAGKPLDAADRASLLDAVQEHARTAYGHHWPYAVLHTEQGTSVAYVRVDLQVDENGDPRPRADTLVYGIEIDRTKLASLLQRAFADDILLPPTLTRGRANQAVVQVEVLDPKGGALFASRPNQPHAHPAEESLPPMLGGGVARASVLPAVADRLIIGGLPKSHAPTLLLIFALAGVLAVAAVAQLHREQRLARLRQDFVASVSHELRTPLAQVRLFTDTLRLGRARNDGQRAWALENIDRETLRLTHLVERILHFSRAERGILPTERESVDVAEEITEAMAAFTPLIPGSRVCFECHVSEGLMVEVDRDCLRQVLLNYLDNAVRYGPVGQTVRVVGEGDADVVRIAVEDQGLGVPPDEREAVFEPFRRGRRAVGTVVSGSGIGLSVVRQIASAFGGRAWVEDASSGGARFVLELPAQHTARPVHFPARSSAPTVSGRATGVEADSEVA